MYFEKCFTFLSICYISFFNILVWPLLFLFIRHLSFMLSIFRARWAHNAHSRVYECFTNPFNWNYSFSTRNFMNLIYAHSVAHQRSINTQHNNTRPSSIPSKHKYTHIYRKKCILYYLYTCVCLSDFIGTSECVIVLCIQYAPLKDQHFYCYLCV